MPSLFAMNIRDFIEQRTGNSYVLICAYAWASNLGPVKLIKDINNQLNLIGDGINNRATYHEFCRKRTIACFPLILWDCVLSFPGICATLSYKGARADKNVRDHYVYAVGHTGLLTVSAHHQPEEKASSVTAEDEINTAGETSLKNIINNGKTVSNKPEQIRTNNKIIFIAVPVIAVIVVTIFFFILTGKDKLSFLNKSAKSSSADTESKQVEMKPNVESPKSKQVEMKT